MSFRPGKTRDLLCPEPGSTTGRAIASLSLRRLNEDFAAFAPDAIPSPGARAAFVEFRREMDALLPGRPKARVAVLASPFVRAPLELALGGAGEAFEEASLAGRFALQLGPGLTRPIELDWARGEVFSMSPLARATLDRDAVFPVPGEAIRALESCAVGELVLVPEAGAAFGLDARAPSEEELERVRAALRLLDAAASTEAAELTRFFAIVVPIASGLDRRPGVLGLSLGEPLALALDVVEALAAEKLERYARLLDRDASPWSAAMRRLSRRAFLHRLGRARHPIAKAPEAVALLASEEEAASRMMIEPDGEGTLSGVVEELSGLL